MADLPWLRDEIARRISDESTNSSFFYGSQERVNNLIDSANGAGVYGTVIKGPPAKAACFIATASLSDPFPRVAAYLNLVQLANYLIAQGWGATISGGGDVLSVTSESISWTRAELQAGDYNGVTPPLLNDLIDGLAEQGF